MRVDRPHSAAGAAPVRPTRVELACANCGQSFIASTTRVRAYCSGQCKAVADVVRYIRRKRISHPGSVPDDIKHAIRIRIAFAPSGGYPAAARIVPKPTRRVVRDREHDRCVLCAAPGQEIDHIDGDSADLDNLRLVCRRCHRDVTARHLHPTQDPAGLSLLARIQLRSMAPRPIRPCDGAAGSPPTPKPSRPEDAPATWWRTPLGVTVALIYRPTDSVGNAGPAEMLAISLPRPGLPARPIEAFTLAPGRGS